MSTRPEIASPPETSSPVDEQLDPRVRELELRFTEQQEMLQQLSDVVYAQERAIERLTLELRQLSRKLEAEPGIVDAQQRDRPPHY